MTNDVAGLPLIKAFKSDYFPLDRLDPGGSGDAGQGRGAGHVFLRRPGR